jgi:hypothetical protein
VVRYFTELPFPVAQVEGALLRSPKRWIVRLAREAGQRGELLLTEVGFGAPGRRVEKKVLIDVGRPFRRPSKTILPITWRATGPSRLFPEMKADIGIAPLGGNRTQLSFSGRYEPPFGLVGRAVDRALLHRVAEGTAKDFLDRTAEVLESMLSPQA